MPRTLVEHSRGNIVRIKRNKMVIRNKIGFERVYNIPPNTRMDDIDKLESGDEIEFRFFEDPMGDYELVGINHIFEPSLGIVNCCAICSRVDIVRFDDDADNELQCDKYRVPVEPFNICPSFREQD